METGTCCLCGENYDHYGNNPRPLADNDDDRCCDECNRVLVIPARLGTLSPSVRRLIKPIRGH